MSQEEIQLKLKELQTLAIKSNVDIGSELNRLSEKLSGSRLSPDDIWKKVEMARHSDRPTTLELIAAMADDFIEL